MSQSDIVPALREVESWGLDGFNIQILCGQAADEIERLRAIVGGIEKLVATPPPDPDQREARS